MLDEAFKIPRRQMESLGFISTIEHHHKVKVSKVIGTSSKLISGGPEWGLNINQIGWDASEVSLLPPLCTPCVVVRYDKADYILTVS